MLLASQISNAKLLLYLCLVLFFKLTSLGKEPGQMAMVIFEDPFNFILKEQTISCLIEQTVFTIFKSSKLSRFFFEKRVNHSLFDISNDKLPMFSLCLYPLTLLKRYIIPVNFTTFCQKMILKQKTNLMCVRAKVGIYEPELSYQKIGIRLHIHIQGSIFDLPADR